MKSIAQSKAQEKQWIDSLEARQEELSRLTDWQDDIPETHHDIGMASEPLQPWAKRLLVVAAGLVAALVFVVFGLPAIADRVWS